MGRARADPGRFTFDAGDAIVHFAQANGMKVKGHTLVWHSKLPSWVSSLMDPDDSCSCDEQPHHPGMTHFKGRSYAWDVVNEALLDGETMRPSVFLELLGPDYIDEAFRTARAADPDALLYYNDYGTDGTNAKANAAFDMYVGMQERGVPFDGVGLQMHTGAPNMGPVLATLEENMHPAGRAVASRLSSARWTSASATAISRRRASATTTSSAPVWLSRRARLSLSGA